MYRKSISILRRTRPFGFGLYGLLVAAGLAGSASFQPAFAQDATACMTEIGRDTLQAAQSGSVQAFLGVVREHADSEQVAIFSLGQYRRLLPPDRQDDFVQLIELFIARTLADNYRKFRASEIRVTGVRPQGNSFNVETRLLFLGGRPSQTVTWRLVSDGDGCKIVDVNVTNVWLGQLLRSAMTGAIQSGGQTIDAAFRYLQPASPSTEVKISR